MRKMESKYAGKCKGTRAVDGDFELCGNTFEPGAKVYYDRDAGGVVGCVACRPELAGLSGASTWVVTVIAVKRATPEFTVLRASVQSVVGPDADRWASIQSTNHAVEIGFGEKKVERNLLEIVGPLGMNMRAGDQCRILGQLEDSKYGLQCKSVSPAILEVTDGDAGVIAFLSRLSYIGEIRARQLIAKFGSGTELWRAIEEDPQKVADSIVGITLGRAQKMAAEYKEAVDLRDTYTALSGKALTPRLIARALEEWKTDASAILDESAYTLLLLDQSWADVDRTALLQGYTVDDERRLAAIAHRLATLVERSGSTWVDKDQVLAGFRPAGSATGAPGDTLDAATANTSSVYHKLLVECGVSTLDMATRIVEVGAKRGMINASTKIKNERVLKLASLPLLLNARAPEAIFPRKLAYFEYGIASNIARLRNASIRPWRKLDDKELDQATNGLTLAEEQLQVIEQVRLNAVSALTGSAGCGKSMVAVAVVALAKANNCAVTICAPTGKAAQVVSQATKHDATTIHRLLARTGSLDELEDGLDATALNKIKNDPGQTGIISGLLIVDESSFLDVAIGYALLSQISGGCRVLFIGDVNQLPPVGAGAVFRDLLESNAIPTTTLKKIFRTRDDSPIPHIAADVRDGVIPEWPRGSSSVHVIDVRGKAGPSANVNPADAARWAADTVVTLVSKEIPNRKLGGAQSGFDVTVLTAQRKGEAGCEQLSLKLQAALNPPVNNGDSIFIGRGQSARPGDTVKQFKNNNTLMVYNGEIGRVIAVDRSGLVLKQPRFENATLMIPAKLVTGETRVGKKKLHHWRNEDSDDGTQIRCLSSGALAPVRSIFVSAEEGHVLVAEFPGMQKGTVRYIAYTKPEVDKLELGYAMTVHSGQGSTFKRVVFVCPSQHRFSLTRANVYTAITRTSDYLAVVGEPELISEAVSNVRDVSRNTRLQGLLNNVMLDIEPSEAQRRNEAASDAESAIENKDDFAYEDYPWEVAEIFRMLPKGS